MPRWWWRLLAVVAGTTAGWAAFVKHDGTFCHDLVRSTFRTHTRGGRIVFTVVLVAFWWHIIRWPSDRPRPPSRRP